MTKHKHKPSVCIFTIHPAKDRRILNRQCRPLQKHGWDITMIAISEEGTYDDDGIQVIGIKKWKSKWQRVKTIFSITYKAYKQKADIYHFHDPDFLPLAALLKLLTFKPVVYDVHEFYRIKWQLKSDNPLIKKLIKFFAGTVEDIFAMLVHNLSVVYDKSAKHFRRLRCNVVVTPNYATQRDFVAEKVTDEDWNSRKNKVVFIGTLAAVRGSLVLLDIVRETKALRPDIEFTVTQRFLSVADEQEMMTKMRQPRYRDLIHFVPSVPSDQLAAVVRRGIIGLSLLQDVGQYQVAIPTKFFEYMSQSLAIVASDLPWGHVYIKQTGCGVLVPPTDAKAYADAIIKLCENPELAHQMGERGRLAFIEKFNWEACEPAFINFYRALGKRK